MRFHEIQNQTVAENFSFLSWETKKVLFLKKFEVYHVPWIVSSPLSPSLPWSMDHWSLKASFDLHVYFWTLRMRSLRKPHILFLIVLLEFCPCCCCMINRAVTAGKAFKAYALPRFWFSIRSYKKQPVKKNWGKILSLAWLKFAVAALINIHRILLSILLYWH